MTDETSRTARAVPDPDWLAAVEKLHRLAFDPEKDTAKRAAQAELLANHDMRRLGNGPSATGGAEGWSMQPTLFFRCVNCGYFMSGDPNAYDECLCGYLTRDRDAVRFGSALGDDAIEVFRATKRTG
jgi:hypothetical protein